MKAGREERRESEMNNLVWFLVLGVACGIGYVLLVRRLGATIAFNSIHQSAGDRPHEEAVDTGDQTQGSPNAQGSRAQGGCCGITR